MFRTVAVIDVGSNSIKLLVARAKPGSRTLQGLFHETIETRISTGIHAASPQLTAEAIAAGTATIAELHRMALYYEPQEIAIVATSAVRDARNGGDFVDTVFDATGLRIRILQGSEEANFIGQGLACDPAIGGIPDFIQTDIGGGSLELIRFAGGTIQQAISLQLGAVRLTEHFVSATEAPVSSETENAIRAHVRDQIRSSDFNFPTPAVPLIATGGAFTVGRAILAAQGDRLIEGTTPHLKRAELDALRRRLVAMPLEARLKIPHLPAARADILPAALITIDVLLDIAGCDQLRHSFFNLRYGIAAHLLFH